MDRRHLTHFLAVVEEGSISGAARHLHLSQPSVSQTIRELERELGATLFVRRRQLRLTSAGRALIGPARQVLRSFETAKASVDEVVGVLTGELDIAVIPALAVDPLVPLIDAFLVRYPDVQIKLMDAPGTADAYQLLHRGQTELLVHDLPASVPGLVAIALGNREALAVFPPAATNVPDRPITWTDLARYRMVAGPYPGPIARRDINDRLAHHAIVPPKAVVETPHRDALIALVLRGVGVTILPPHEAELARARGAILRPLADPVVRQFALFHRDDMLSPAARAFVRMLSAPSTNDAGERNTSAHPETTIAPS